jgi:RHS repeat-associated protein
MQPASGHKTRDQNDNVVVSASLAGQIASRQILRYGGYAYDSESGLYYWSARYYDPLTRQFTTKDALKADGEESEYQYCGGDPFNATDPSGYWFGWAKTVGKALKKAAVATYHAVQAVRTYSATHSWVQYAVLAIRGPKMGRGGQPR